ncbi:hypothetical protein [Nostoc sp.]|uniref:hypothetical protein n=1 Tax=Nostoc sp. TaxID=1180 RepID=UPI002FF9C644
MTPAAHKPTLWLIPQTVRSHFGISSLHGALHPIEVLSRDMNEKGNSEMFTSKCIIKIFIFR